MGTENNLFIPGSRRIIFASRMPIADVTQYILSNGNMDITQESDEAPIPDYTGFRRSRQYHNRPTNDNRNFNGVFRGDSSGESATDSNSDSYGGNAAAYDGFGAVFNQDAIALIDEAERALEDEMTPITTETRDLIAQYNRQLASRNITVPQDQLSIMLRRVNDQLGRNNDVLSLVREHEQSYQPFSGIQFTLHVYVFIYSR